MSAMGTGVERAGAASIIAAAMYQTVRWTIATATISEVLEHEHGIPAL